MSDDSEKINRGRKASVEGFANEHVAVGLLMKRYSNVSLVDLPLSTYDIVLVRKNEDKEEFIRIQVKTATKNINFKGGTRGGRDRYYRSGVTSYRQSRATSDLVAGVHQNPDKSFSLYFVPTILIEKLNQGSITLNRIEGLKDNFEVLEHCKDEAWVLEKGKQLNLL